MTAALSFPNEVTRAKLAAMGGPIPHGQRVRMDWIPQKDRHWRQEPVTQVNHIRARRIAWRFVQDARDSREFMQAMLVAVEVLVTVGAAGHLAVSAKGMRVAKEGRRGVPYCHETVRRVLVKMIALGWVVRTYTGAKETGASRLALGPGYLNVVGKELLRPPSERAAGSFDRNGNPVICADSKNYMRSSTVRSTPHINLQAGGAALSRPLPTVTTATGPQREATADDSGPGTMPPGTSPGHAVLTGVVMLQ